VHAWIYAVTDGLVRDLNFCATAADDATALFNSAVASLPPKVPSSG